MLTDRQIKTHPHVDKDVFLADRDGLYLRVRPSGAKTFVYRRQARSGARTTSRWVTLGKYPAMTLLEARRRTLELAGSALPDSRTVAQAWEEYDRRVVSTFKSAWHVRQRINANLIPRLGQVQVSQVTRAQLSQLLQDVVDRGAQVQANRLLTSMKQLFGYCEQRGWRKDNPLENVKRRMVGGEEEPRKRVLAMDEIGSWWWAFSRHERTHVRTKLALGVVLLTGQRGAEVCAMERGDIDGRWWRIDRNKSDREHQAFLNPQARRLLECAFELFGDAPFGYKPGILAKAVLRRGADWTPHDLRRTMSTHLAETGTPPHVVEKMLNHALPGVAGVYNRATYADETRRAWIKWGRMVAAARKKARL
jgi:integrase